MIRSQWSRDVFLDNLPWWSISVLVSLVFGTWVSKIIDESGQRAELIDTLQRTRAELAEANHAAGVVAERERLALEIHDTLAQGFTGIITLAGAAQALVARGDLEQAVEPARHDRGHRPRQPRRGPRARGGVLPARASTTAR